MENLKSYLVQMCYQLMMAQLYYPLEMREGYSNIANDLVYIFAGGELPTQFLEKAGIKITKKFGETVMKH